MININETLIKIYNAISIDGKQELKVNIEDEAFEYVDKFLEAYETTNYPELIYKNSMDVSNIKIGCLLDICIWSSKDNGLKQVEIIQEWMRQSDERKLEIALSVTNVFPLNDHIELTNRLDQIKRQFPSLIYLCEYWEKQLSNPKNEKKILKTKTPNLKIGLTNVSKLLKCVFVNNNIPPKK